MNRRTFLETVGKGSLGQLYDLKTDPYEQTNLWDERPDIVKKMKELLNAHREQPNTRTLATRALK